LAATAGPGPAGREPAAAAAGFRLGYFPAGAGFMPAAGRDRHSLPFLRTDQGFGPPRARPPGPGPAIPSFFAPASCFDSGTFHLLLMELVTHKSIIRNPLKSRRKVYLLFAVVIVFQIARTVVFFADGGWAIFRHENIFARLLALAEIVFY
jgi:hypothetical protein